MSPSSRLRQLGRIALHRAQHALDLRRGVMDVRQVLKRAESLVTTGWKTVENDGKMMGNDGISYGKHRKTWGEMMISMWKNGEQWWKGVKVMKNKWWTHGETWWTNPFHGENWWWFHMDRSETIGGSDGNLMVHRWTLGKVVGNNEQTGIAYGEIMVICRNIWLLYG